MDNSNDKYGFISYSRKDTDFVKRIVKDLRQEGFSLWIDSDMQPGTPDWETAIRKAMKDSKVVLYFASSDARISTYVKDELSLADRFTIPIIPLWIKGQHWNDCIPLGKGHIQHIDLRENYYQKIEITSTTLKAYLSANPDEMNIPALINRLVKQHFKSEEYLMGVIQTLHEDWFLDWGSVIEIFYGKYMNHDLVYALLDEEILHSTDFDYFDHHTGEYAGRGVDFKLTLLGKKIYQELENKIGKNRIDLFEYRKDEE